MRRNGCGIKGNIETKLIRPDIKSRNVEMRNELDLFVNVLHCSSKKGVKTRHENIDIVVVRQNTEGEYAMLEHQNVPGVVESLKIVTAENTSRLVNYAFQYAIAHGRKKVTLVHKAVSLLVDMFYLNSNPYFVEHHEIDRRIVPPSCHRCSQKLPKYRV